MCRQAGSSPTIISSRSSKGSDYAEVPHGGWPENKVLANAMRHNPGYGIMRQFMGERCIIVIVAGEQRDRRHSDAIGHGLVIGLRALVPQLGRNLREEGVEFVALSGGRHWLDRRRGEETHGQVIDLVGVEHRKAFEDAACLVFLFASGGIFDLFGITLVEDRDRRLLALADLPAQFLGLAIGHPVGRGETAHVGDQP